MRKTLKSALVTICALLLLQLTALGADVDVVPSLSYSDINCEAILLNKGVLHIEVQVKNNKPSTKISLNIATYESSTGRLSDIKIITQTIENGATVSLIFDYDVTSAIQNNRYIKAFAWENDTVEPHNIPIIIKTMPADLFGNTIQSATPINLTKLTEGNINSTTDIDFVKFTPTQTGDYIIQTTGSTNTAGTLYKSDMTTVLSTNNNMSSQDDNFLIRETLTAGQTYYLKINGESNSTGAYTLSIGQKPSNMAASIVQNSVLLKGNVATTIGNSKSVTLKLLNSSNSVIATQNTTTSSTGDLNATIPYTVVNGTYRLIALYNSKACEVLDLNVLTSAKSYMLNAGNYCSIPFAVSNAKTLSNVEFSLSYATTDFDMYDVCDHTQAVETGTGQISTAYLNITNVNSGYVTFKSIRTTSNWSGVANTVKLKAKNAGSFSVTSYTYQVK